MLHNLQNEANKIRLSAAEKAQMRASVFGMSSPLAPSKAEGYVWLSIFSYNTRMVTAGLLVFVLVGAGTAQAAQGSLPGDLLYRVKVSVTEKVETALAHSSSAKAAVEVKLATRRVEEAETLASQGRLNATTSAELATNFDQHAESAQQLADQVEATDPAAAADVKASLSASLSVHSAILAEAGNSDGANNKKQADDLSARVLARAGASDRLAFSQRSTSKAVAVRAFAAMTPTAGQSAPAVTSIQVSVNQNSEASTSAAMQDKADQDAGLQKDAADFEFKAAASLDAARAHYVAASSTLDAETNAQLGKVVASASAQMSLGSTELGAGQYAQAIEDFKRALTISARVSALLGVQHKFDSSILRILIQQGDK